MAARWRSEMQRFDGCAPVRPVWTPWSPGPRRWRRSGPSSTPRGPSWRRSSAPGFSRIAESLALTGALLRYDGRGLTVEELDERLPRDLERAVTGAGPHLRDASITAGGRELRGFGSQGEQRTAVLALVLAEAELLADRRGEPPLLLLDDVFSELDTERRGALLAQLPAGAQTVITATHTPGVAEPDLIVEVTPGAAKVAA